MVETMIPQRMTFPRSVANKTDTAKMPGVGGTIVCVKELAKKVYPAIVDIDFLRRLAMTDAMGATNTCVMSPNTGMDMIYAAIGVVNSKFLPRNTVIKKLTMDRIAFVSRIPWAMMEPKMMVQPMLPRVFPKPLVNVSIVSIRGCPMPIPVKMGERNRAMVGCTFHYDQEH